MRFKNKAMATLFVTILVSSMAISLGILAQPASAEVINGVNYDANTAAAIHAGMTWDLNANASANRLLLWNRFHDQIPTWAFLIASPNPVGVGQTFNMIMMNPQVPQNALLTNDIRYMFTIDVTKPDGATEKLPPAGASRGSVAQGGIINGQFVSDSTGSTYTAYTPDQTGNYTFVLHFQQLQYLWQSNNPAKPHYFTGVDNTWYGVTLKASDYTLVVTVQQDPVTLNGLPIIQEIPTEYWTRPIEGQNTGWYQVSSNWLSGPHDRDNGGAENRYQAEGIAPNSAHILWTRPTEDNGLVGGLIGARDENTAGNAFNAGSQYQPRWTNQIIMYGRLYYSPNVLTSGSSSAMDCVDLRTGELIWERDTGGANVEGLLGVSTTANMAQFGYYYSQDDPNEHGIQNPGWLFSSNYAIGYQPERGIPYLNITGVPSGFELQAPTGENIRYVLTNIGTTANPSYVLSQWNSSKTIPMIGAGSNPSSNQINASTTARFDFYRIPLSFKFATTPTIRAGIIGDYLWGSNGSWPTGTSGPNYSYPDEVTIWKISVKPDSTFGNLVYMKNMRIDDSSSNQNEMFERATGAERRFVTIVVPSCSFKIYDIDTGNLVGTTDAQANFQAYGYFTWPSLISQTQTKMAYGTLFTGGYTGAVSAYSLADGSLMWRNVYPAGGQKIPNYVQMIGMIADGKIFVGTHEHSADTPLYKGERIKALNATTGAEVWSMAGWAYPMTWAVADGIAVFWNNYDAQVYAIGKGPSQTTTYVQNDVVTFGSSVMIKGTVTDISAGTKQEEQAARFPTGVPAVNDASQAQWMEYVYMQKGKPTNTTGVDVTISVIDANGNFREIGTTKTIDGFFSLTWKPDITGTYTVYASFAGTESYWPSHAVTAFNVDAAAPTATAQPTQGPSMADLYAIPAIAGLFVFVAIIGLVIILVLRKRP